MESNSKKIKKEKKSAKIAVFDEKEREDFLKSKYGSKKKRKQEYIEKKEKKEKEMLKNQKKEVARERKEAMDKYRKLLDDRERVLTESSFISKEPKVKKQKVKAGGQTFSITTTLL